MRAYLNILKYIINVAIISLGELIQSLVANKSYAPLQHNTVYNSRTSTPRTQTRVAKNFFFSRTKRRRNENVRAVAWDVDKYTCYAVAARSRRATYRA